MCKEKPDSHALWSLFLGILCPGSPAPCWCHVLSSAIESGKVKSATSQESQALPSHSLSFQCLAFKALNEHGNHTLKVMGSPSAMLCYDAEMHLLGRKWDFNLA